MLNCGTVEKGLSELIKLTLRRADNEGRTDFRIDRCGRCADLRNDSGMEAD